LTPGQRLHPGVATNHVVDEVSNGPSWTRRWETPLGLSNRRKNILKNFLGFTVIGELYFELSHHSMLLASDTFIVGELAARDRG
jgi:hypothetical protein